jgi:hypothetical protein
MHREEKRGSGQRDYVHPILKISSNIFLGDFFLIADEIEPADEI